MGAFCRFVDAVNDRVGKWVAWLFLPLILFVVFEIVLRGFFSKPTIWVWDLNFHLGAMLAALGAGYTLSQGGHVLMDIVVERFSSRTRAIIDLITASFFFLSIGMVLWLGIGEAKEAYKVREIFTSLWEPYMWPLKTIIIIGFFLLLIQGIVKFIRDLLIALGARGKKI